MEIFENPVLQENLRNLLEFSQSIYWLVHNRGQIGFRHLCMLLLVLVYTLLGGVMFFSIETRYDSKTISARLEISQHNIHTSTPEFHLMSSMMTNSAYVSLLKNESLYAISTYYKSLDPANLKWTYGSAIFFSMNLYTTTGYGSIAPESMLGQFCAIWYSVLTIPVTLVVVRDLGQWLLVHLTKIYVHALVYHRRTMGYIEQPEDTMISLPIKFCISLLAGYLLVSSVFVYLLDDWYGDTPHTGVSFFIAFYFSYISLSTIGLGDIMPNNATLRSLLIDHLVIQFHPAISTLFFFGSPVMKVVNRVTYIFIENGIFGTFQMTSGGLPMYRASAAILPDKPGTDLVHVFKNEATVMLNGLTIRSLATFARANADVYGGGFGRVNLRKGDLVQSKTSVNNNQASP
ncbi:unnamed protein product [Angiostrongylus costaricensis]|uniref:Ion channel n=1 Tax=Angiostrongylus costaricensis TaxID=334426 RepID=A0A158PEA9_ANGCS|nr:unnamed protein product [Angiostrongylus costaricensis]